MSNNIADDFLLGGGGATAKFDAVGDTITGIITATDVTAQTDIGTGKILTWDDGSTRMQLVVTLQTDLRDDEDDDGLRKLYVKGSKKAGSQSLHDAVATAVRSVGARSLEIGGKLTVSYIGDEPAKTRGFNDRKLYSGSYQAPDKAAAAAGFLGTEPAASPAAAPAPVQPAAAPPAPAPAAPAVPAAAAPAEGPDPVKAAQQMIALNLPDNVIAQNTGLNEMVIAALRGQANAA